MMYLPESIREIADLIGMDATVELVRRRGGTTIPIPKGIQDQGIQLQAWLEEIIGGEAAATLCQHYGGENIYIPKCENALRTERNRRIHQDFDELIERGYSANSAVVELATSYRLSDRRIWDILSTVPCVPDESDYASAPGLFDGIADEG